jgi:hypothetical protein
VGVAQLELLVGGGGLEREAGRRASFSSGEEGWSGRQAGVSSAEEREESLAERRGGGNVARKCAGWRSRGGSEPATVFCGYEVSPGEEGSSI